MHFFFKSFTSRTGFTPPWHLSPGIFRYLKGRENLLTEYRNVLLDSCLFPEQDSKNYRKASRPYTIFQACREIHRDVLGVFFVFSGPEQTKHPWPCGRDMPPFCLKRLCQRTVTQEAHWCIVQKWEGAVFIRGRRQRGSSGAALIWWYLNLNPLKLIQFFSHSCVNSYTGLVAAILDREDYRTFPSSQKVLLDSIFLDCTKNTAHIPVWIKAAFHSEHRRFTCHKGEKPSHPFVVRCSSLPYRQNSRSWPFSSGCSTHLESFSGRK